MALTNSPASGGPIVGLAGYGCRMNETEIKALCTRVNGLINDLEEHLSPEEFVEQIENYEEVLMGAMIARGYLEDTVDISEKTIPFIKASEVALAQALTELEGEDEDDEDDEEDEDEEFDEDEDDE